MKVELVKSYRFEAAHETDFGHGDLRLHGHSYEVELVVRGECDPALEWLIDYGEISAQFEEVYNALDHRLLNEVEGLKDTTLAGLREWLKPQMVKRIPSLGDVRVRILGNLRFEPALLDTDSCVESSPDLPPRVRFGFEAAHALPRLPKEHKCYRMHGHSFAVEVGSEDLGGLQSRLKPVYDQLDHRCLNDIQGLENPTSEVVSRWIWNELAATSPGLTVVVVAETCTARCVFRGK